MKGQTRHRICAATCVVALLGMGCMREQASQALIPPVPEVPSASASPRIPREDSVYAEFNRRPYTDIASLDPGAAFPDSSLPAAIAMRGMDDEAEAPAQPSGRAAHMRWDETVYEFGEVWQGERVRHRFAFTNVGVEPLEIRELVTGMGCLRATCKPLRIAPGKQGYVDIAVDTRGRVGRQVLHVDLHTNGDVRAHRLLMRGVIRTRVRADLATPKAREQSGTTQAPNRTFGSFND